MNDKELKERFESYKATFEKGDGISKFAAANDMMLTLSNYLQHNVRDIDITPLTSVMAEYAQIDQGGAPEFLKPKTKKPGRKFIPRENLDEASVVAAIQILHRHGLDLIKAFEFAAANSKFTVGQLEQLRKDFNRHRRMPEATQYLFEQSNLKFSDQIEMEDHVLALLEMSNN